MCLQDTARIPLRAKDGSIRAYAIVDAADAEWASRWAWHLNNNGYAARHEWDGTSATDRTVLLHRELLGLVYGDHRHGDHIDRDRLNCRRANLRSLPHAGSMQNKSSYRGARSAYRGVTWSKHARKWTAQVSVRGKHINLGYFDTEQQAAEAARAGRARLLPYAVD
jgi:hypothetical protein